MRNLDLDDEEKEIVSSFEKDEWKSVKNIKKEKTRARKAVSKTSIKPILSTEQVADLRKRVKMGIPKEGQVA